MVFVGLTVEEYCGKNLPLRSSSRHSAPDFEGITGGGYCWKNLSCKNLNHDPNFSIYTVYHAVFCAPKEQTYLKIFNSIRNQLLAALGSFPLTDQSRGNPFLPRVLLMAMKVGPKRLWCCPLRKYCVMCMSSFPQLGANGRDVVLQIPTTHATRAYLVPTPKSLQLLACHLPYEALHENSFNRPYSAAREATNQPSRRKWDVILGSTVPRDYVVSP